MPIAELLTTLTAHVSLMVAAAFVLLTLQPVRRLGFRQGVFGRMFLILFFGGIGILGTYGGGEVGESFANLRAMGVVTAGLFGGPVVGAGAGLIAGSHRILIDIGGFSAVPCGLATLTEGVAAGWIAREFLRENALNWRPAVLLAATGEALHMGLVLLFSRPFPAAVHLVSIIALPMIVSNAVGTGLFVHLIRTLARARETEHSHHAETILDIANRTVNHLREGLTQVSAAETAQILYDRLPVGAVAITDTRRVLAHVGAGHDHHLPGEPIRTRFTREVMEKGTPLFRNGHDAIGCPVSHCPFTSALVVPLKKKNTIVGTLKLYGTRSHKLRPADTEIAKGLAGLFATQLELQEIRLKSQMLAQAEIRRLQAQINPHFLFNALNTIASFCRTNPARARELIQDLSFYMRKNLDGETGIIRLSDECEQIRAYFAIASARFGERIQVVEKIPEEVMDWPVPALLIQPFVENAVRHGLAPLEEGGVVTITVEKRGDHLNIRIHDNGIGMPEAIIRQVLTEDAPFLPGSHVGIRNCRKRLSALYGPEAEIAIFATPETGTTISFTIPRLPEAIYKNKASAHFVPNPDAPVRLVAPRPAVIPPAQSNPCEEG